MVSNYSYHIATHLTTLNVDDAVNSDYIQPSSSTALPSISVFSTKPEIDMQQPKRAPQMKYGPYNNKKDTEKYTTTSNSSYTGLGRGKGKILHPVALLQRGQQYKRPTEPVNYEYEKEFVPKKDPKEPISLTPDSNPSFPFTKSEPLHKPERYSTQRMKQAQSADHNNVTTSNVGIPVMNANSPNPGLNRPPSTQDQGYNASMRIGEHPQQETRSSMMDVPYSEFYPTPYKEEMVGNQMSAMHPFNMMPDYMISPDVMKEGDFQQMQFPPFIPQEMTMNMKGAPNMMGGIPYISNPPEYTMGSEVPPNLQSDLFVPMQSYYPPI
ncbi:hypothetical protein LOD99_4102 [Oopsacas minuta]|uniref:Uncharacterized protein n=1 Tax=Oopsacas minuta TaxID=111878 RepID=A0AAV7JV00_9METZ|nr:hypothetical protein LOD99_4102 [Oopsacas minuta]